MIVRMISSTGAVVTLAVKGITNAIFYRPMGVAVDSSGRYVYVGDENNNLVRKLALPPPPSPAIIVAVTHVAGNSASGFADGTASTARFQSPAGVAIEPSGNTIIADFSNHRIRKVTPSGAVTSTWTCKVQSPIELGKLRRGRRQDQDTFSLSGL